MVPHSRQGATTRKPLAQATMKIFLDRLQVFVSDLNKASLE